MSTARYTVVATRVKDPNFEDPIISFGPQAESGLIMVRAAHHFDGEKVPLVEYTQPHPDAKTFTIGGVRFRKEGKTWYCRKPAPYDRDEWQVTHGGQALEDYASGTMFASMRSVLPQD